jgi:hypothetical protein
VSLRNPHPTWWTVPEHLFNGRELPGQCLLLCCDRSTSCGSQRIRHSPSFVEVIMASSILELDSDKPTVILHNLVVQRPFGRNSQPHGVDVGSAQPLQYGYPLRQFKNMFCAPQCFTRNLSGCEHEAGFLLIGSGFKSRYTPVQDLLLRPFLSIRSTNTG